MTDDEEKRWSAYLYEDSAVLRNKKDIRYKATWHGKERDYTSSRFATLPELDFRPGSLVENLKAVHFYLFQDCYEWAGEFRNVDMGKSNPFHPGLFGFFCDYDKIPDELSKAQKISDALVEQAPSLSAEAKIKMLAQLHAALNFAHPFREGNGRFTRAFMEEIAEHVGIDLNFGLIDGDEMIAVSQKSMAQPEGFKPLPFEELYAKIAA
ncbi:MAG: Fic family protein [Corynebacterium sp.]|nr:Fic family protein [Corynebacterium sp.]